MIRPRLGVNVDHVATVREARGTSYPDPVHAAVLAESAGADQITVHLRLDRRHVNERDIRTLRETVETRLNLEMSATREMREIATDIRPDMVTVVPEDRQERTTEGGLAVAQNQEHLSEFIDKLRASGAHVSLFIDPSESQIRASAELGVDLVELHTGDYCEAPGRFTNRKQAADGSRTEELQRLQDGAELAADLDLHVAAGHGLNMNNIRPVAAIPQIEEFNIGHSIVSRAVLVGFDEAVREMHEALVEGRRQG